MLARYATNPALAPILVGRQLGEPIGLIVPAGELGASVGVFVVCALCCLALLVARRYFLGAELGLRYRWPSFVLLLLLWFTYVALSWANPF
jgi:hypothetical protein